MGKRTFGAIRKLPSGRYQARYLKDGKQYVGGTTFGSVADADAFLAEKQTEIRNQLWIDPDRGAVTFRTYANQWLDDAVNLRPTTRSLYRILLDKWLLPALGDMALSAMTPEDWRRWFTKMRTVKQGSLQPAKAYRLARTILNSAVDDRRIALNPCVVKGASSERSPERPVASIEEIHAIAANIEPEYRALVLLGAFASLRFGEAAGLRRRNIDLLHRTVTIEGQAVELADGSTIFGPPKTDAGLRTVALSDAIVGDIEEHLDEFVGPEPDALLFTASNGAPLRRTKFRHRWLRAVAAAGVPDLHFHDLRGSGATLAAHGGATVSELMRRLGHRSPAAAMRYQHATDARDRVLADAMDEAIRKARPTPQAEVVPIG